MSTSLEDLNFLKYVTVCVEFPKIAVPKGKWLTIFPNLNQLQGDYWFMWSGSQLLMILSRNTAPTGIQVYHWETVQVQNMLYI